jgi:hypothetical protein
MAVRLNPLVYAWHVHELMGCEPPVGGSRYWSRILKRLAKGKGKVARRCLKEACSKATSRQPAPTRSGEQEHHRRPSLRGQLAPDNKTR